MDLAQNARFNFGLSAPATARGTGVEWTPRLGVASAAVPLPLADVLASWHFTFPAAAGLVGFESVSSWDITLTGAATTITVSGITGTGAGSLNVAYVLGAEAVNGMPAWTLGSASIRWVSGYWTIMLSGVAQFVMKRPAAVPSVTPADWEIASGGAATGLPALVMSPAGASPVQAGGFSQLDFEGQPLLSDITQGLLVHCTAGRVAFDFGGGTVVLSSGQHFQLGLPGGEGAVFLGGYPALMGCAADSAASVTLAATEL